MCWWIRIRRETEIWQHLSPADSKVEVFLEEMCDSNNPPAPLPSLKAQVSQKMASVSSLTGRAAGAAPLPPFSVWSQRLRAQGLNLIWITFQIFHQGICEAFYALAALAKLSESLLVA